MGVCERKNPPRVLSDAELTHVFRGRAQVAVENTSIADSVKVRFVASKTDQNREGCTTTRTQASNAGEPGGGSAGAFELLLDLLDVHPFLEGVSPLMVRLTPQDWKAFRRTEAVAALRLMIASSGRDPALYASHSGRIGGASQLAAQGLSELQTHRVGKWKSRVFMSYVREGGEGPESFSTALAQLG